MENTNLQNRLQDIKNRLQAKKSEAWSHMVKLEMKAIGLRELRLMAA